MSTPFAQHLQADGSSRWWQAVPGRYVDSGQYQLVEWLAAGGVPEVVPYVAPPEPEPVVRRFNKLRIVRGLEAAGLLPAFLAWLDSSPSIRAQWEAAQDVAEDDPVFGPALAQFGAAAGLSAERIEQFLEEARA